MLTDETDHDQQKVVMITSNVTLQRPGINHSKSLKTGIKVLVCSII